eukprot:10634652-Prorocentrum_lima.AAC.1
MTAVYWMKAFQSGSKVSSFISGFVTCGGVVGSGSACICPSNCCSSSWVGCGASSLLLASAVGAVG